MFAGLKPYATHFESGEPWVGRIPRHWTMKRGKALFAESHVPVRDGDEIVTCFRDGQVTLRRNRRAGGFMIALKELGYQGVRRGQLVVHAMDAFAGAVGISDSDGKCTPEYIVCNARHRDLTPGYFAYALRLAAHSSYIQVSCPAVRERAPRLRYPNLGDMLLPVPPNDEQGAIVRFLDHADRRIRRYIHTKQRLVKLLDEQQQAITHRAVTRGLDPNAPLKSTGSAWFPEIPSHWDLLPMRRVITRAVDGPHHSPKYLETGIPFLSARNVKADRWSLDDVKFISKSDFDEFSLRVVPQVGDVLYTKGGTTGVARAVDMTDPFQVWVHIAVLKLIPAAIDPYYLAAALNSPRCYEQAQILTRGATNQDLGLGRMKEIQLPVPPLVEQQRIVRSISGTTCEIRSTISTAQQEVTLLREYRTRLFADVVTGKLDVRAAAAALPDESADVEIFDDDDLLRSHDAEDGDRAPENDDT